MNKVISLIVDISILEDIAYGCPIVSTKLKPINIKLPINAYIYVEHNSNVDAIVKVEDIKYNPKTHRYDWYIHDCKAIDKSLEECGIGKEHNTIKVVPSFLMTEFYE